MFGTSKWVLINVQMAEALASLGMLPQESAVTLASQVQTHLFCFSALA